MQHQSPEREQHLEIAYTFDQDISIFIQFISTTDKRLGRRTSEINMHCSPNYFDINNLASVCLHVAGVQNYIKAL